MVVVVVSGPQCDISVGKQQLTKCTPIHLIYIYGRLFLSLLYPPCIVCFLYSYTTETRATRERAAFSYFHVFLSFIFLSLLLLLTWQSQKGKRSFVNRLYTQRATHKWQNKDELKSFFSRHPWKIEKIKFLFFESVKQPKNRTICLLYLRTSKIFFFRFRFRLRIFILGCSSSRPRCQFHHVVSSSCVKSELALIINQ